MHSAPSVSYPVGRCLFAAGFLGAAWLLGGAVLLAWAGHGTTGWRIVTGVSLWLAAGLATAAWWWRAPRAALRWDGAEWHFGERLPPLAASPRPVLDLQRWMLLRLPAASGAPWLWVAQDSAPSYWDALRRAVYCRAGGKPQQGAKPPVA